MPERRRSRAAAWEGRERERAERERAALQEKIIHAQRTRLAEMSTPIIPITDRIVVMPLIVFTVDAERAQSVLETALRGAAEGGVQVMILDITGMRHIDTAVAGTLVHTANALRLLGTQAVLTGVRPELARTLVELSIDLEGIVMQGTLQSGIAYAARRIGLRWF